jgi:hypothetical protein
MKRQAIVITAGLANPDTASEGLRKSKRINMHRIANADTSKANTSVTNRINMRIIIPMTIGISKLILP